VSFTNKDIARFWEKVNKDGPVLAHVAHLGPCWIWTAYRKERGYGQFRVGGRSVSAHRIAVALDGKPIPDGMHVCHHCDNPSCVNPAHLFLGTNQDNCVDAGKKGRLGTCNKKKTRCPRGHEYTKANTFTDPRGRRQCRECDRDAHRQKYKALAQPAQEKQP
jgi:hypothetical protein